MRFMRTFPVSFAWYLAFALLGTSGLGCGDDAGSTSADFPFGGAPRGPNAATGAGAGPGAGGTGGIAAGGGVFGGAASVGGGVAGGGAGGAIVGGSLSGGATAPPPLPPEVEIDVPFEAPQAGRTTVYVPNPGTHRVAAVNAQTFAIETLPSGLSPTYAATVPGQDVAIVLNVGSRDVSILRTTDGKTSLKRLPVRHDQNAIAVAPDGLHALIYFDARLSKQLAKTFQDVSVLNLTPGEETVRGVSVGYRPRAVQFSRDSQRAFVVTEDGVSVIDVAATDSAPSIANLVPVGDRVGEPVSLDVQIVADGNYAVARREGDPRLRLVDLRSGSIQPLTFESLQPPPPPPPPLDAGVLDGGVDGGTDAPPRDAGAAADGGDAGTGFPLPAGNLELTDLDLTPDGRYALAVVRNAGALLQIPIPAGFADPSAIEILHVEDALVGSVVVSKQGQVAALFSTVSDSEALVLVDLAESGFTQRAVRLRKAIRAVALSDDGTRALVLHQKNGAAGASSEDARIDASEGYSLVEVPRGIAKLQLTTAAVRESDLLVTPDTSHMFLLLRDDAASVRSVEIVDLRSFQVKTEVLAKPPASLGLIPDAKRLFIGQQSEGGMITFLDVETGDVVHAVSGFELSGRVRQ
jgi:hypothetical protein